MRIAFVGPFGLHPNKTMGSRAMGLARPLVQAGHQIALYMPPWQTPEKADRQWNEDGVAIRYTSLNGGILGTTRRLVKETLAWKPDIVHCFKPKAYSGLAAWWFWEFYRLRFPLIVDSDDWEGWGGWNDLSAYSAVQKHFFSWQEGWGMSHCHILTVASRALQSIAWSRGIPASRVKYLPNGPGFHPDGENFPTADEIDRQKQALGLEKRPVLLVYSRMFEFDTSRLVKVLAGVREAIPEIALLFVGQSLKSEDAVILNRQLDAAGVRSSIIDLGWVSLEDLPLTLSLATVGLYLMDDTLLNRAKCPVKLVDQVALGIPMVAEAVGQVPEYVQNGRSGHLRPSGDVPGLVADILSLFNDSEKRERMSAAARTLYKTEFTWELLSSRLEEIYDSAL